MRSGWSWGVRAKKKISKAFEVAQIARGDRKLLIRVYPPRDGVEREREWQTRAIAKDFLSPDLWAGSPTTMTRPIRSFFGIVRRTSVSNTAQRLGMHCYSVGMQKPVKERIAKWRDEIAQIREANRQYLQGGKNKIGAAGDHARRLQRLQEILDELMALTDWKKL